MTGAGSYSWHDPPVAGMGAVWLSRMGTEGARTSATQRMAGGGGDRSLRRILGPDMGNAAKQIL